MTFGDSSTWLTFAAVVAAMIGGIFIGDALGREWRAMIDDDLGPPKRPDQPPRDGPAPYGDVIEVPHDARGPRR